MRGRSRRRRLKRTVWNLVAIALLVVLVFPVYWMISTAFKPDDEINSLDADVVLDGADAPALPRTR